MVCAGLFHLVNYQGLDMLILYQHMMFIIINLDNMFYHSTGLTAPTGSDSPVEAGYVRLLAWAL